MSHRLRILLAATLVIALAIPTTTGAAEDPPLQAADVSGNDDLASAEALDTSDTVVAGSLGPSDTWDVYYVDLLAGQELAVWMKPPTDVDFDLLATTPVTGANPLAASENEDDAVEAFTLVAPANGRYYVHVESNGMSGSYSLKAKLETLGVDEEVPGVQLPASGSTGYLNPYGDQDDFYYVDLVAGEKFSAKISGASGTDFNLYLYAPETTTTVGTQVAWGSMNQIYPESFTYVASTSGRYYLDVESKSGSGSYTLYHKKASSGADDEIPGEALPPSPVVRDLDRYGDGDDVFAVTLGAGKSLRFKFSGPVTSDYDLFVFGPGATSVFSDESIMSWEDYATPAGNVESGIFTAPADGTYYVDLYSAWGSGTYTFAYSIGEESVLKFSGPTTINYGATATFKGSLTETDTTPRAGEKVLFQRRSYGSTTWATIGQASVDASGSFVFTAKPSRRTDYRAYFSGAAGERLAYASSMVTVKPRVSISRPWAPTSVRKGARFLSAGYVKPRQTSGSKTIKIYAQRYESGKWVTRRAFTATNSNYSSYSRYKAYVSLPYAGRWRLIAISATNSKNAYSKSSYRYLSVR